MVRTVKIELQADVAGYIASMRASKDATNEVDGKVEALNRDLDKVPANAAKAAAAMKLLGSDGKAAAMQLDDGIGRNSTSLGVLEGKLTSARMSVHRLAEEFNRTGNSGTLIKLFDTQDEIRGLEDLKTKLVGALDESGRQGAPSFWSQLSDGAKNSLSGPGIGLMPLLVGAAVAASPLIAGALNAALIAGVGFGGLAAGLVGQFHDPQVHAALVGLGHDFMTQLSFWTKGMAGPLTDAINEISQALQHAVAATDWSKVTDMIGPLAGGISGLIDAMGPGMADMFSALKPVLAEFAKDLPAIGMALSDFFHEVAGGKGNVEGLRVLLMLIIGSLELLGHTLGSLSNAFDWFLRAGERGAAMLTAFGVGLGALGRPLANVGALMLLLFGTATDTSPPIERLGRALRGTGDDAAFAVDDLGKVSSSIGSVATTSMVAGKAAAFLFDKLMGVDQATLGLHQSATQLHDTLAKNRKTLDENTVAGQQNAGALLDAVRANMELYRANVDSGMSAKDAADAYDAGYAAVVKQAKGAGLGATAVDGLIGKYRSVPDSVAGATGSIGDMTVAIDRLVSQIRTLLGLPNSKEFHLTVIEEVRAIGPGSEIRGLAAKALGNRWGGVYEHAATGLLREAAYYGSANPGRYMIAEPQTGGEAFVPKYGDYQRSKGILSEAAGWYGLDVVPRWEGGRFAASSTNSTSQTSYSPSIVVNAPGADGPSIATHVERALERHARSMNLRNRAG